jgi:hypothetical protein
MILGSQIELGISKSVPLWQPYLVCILVYEGKVCGFLLVFTVSFSIIQAFDYVI